MHNAPGTKHISKQKIKAICRYTSLPSHMVEKGKTDQTVPEYTWERRGEDPHIIKLALDGSFILWLLYPTKERD